MIASLSKNTISQYSVTYKIWWMFCKDNNLNVFKYCPRSVLQFLTEQYNKGSAYGTLNNHRSALSLLLGGEVGADEQIKRLLKGAYRSRPATPKYVRTWDPKIVLDHIASFGPNKELSLEKITKKLVILLTLCTGQRVQSLSLIKLSNIMKCANGIKIVISDIIKTSAPGREQPMLFLPYYESNKDICPATTLEDYVTITANLRSKESEYLLLTIKSPHKVACAQTISRWVKQTLGESGVDVSVFSAHSTRHASTSAARSAGVSLDIIRKTAGWTKTSEAFAKFYHRPIIDEGNFAKAVLD
ncbi:hypothetical protein ABMA27_005052 [Loxostege sticticalis]|uniref:Tyr recombinase domain-containing protein n=1 Tax=Loxostege sticticalis TaxID=481309 RepID=A0ABR3HLM2_LOXSC